MLSNGFQSYFWHFGEFANFDQIWDVGPPYLLQKYFGKIQEKCELVLTILFYTCQVVGIRQLHFLIKGGRRQMMKMRLNIS